MSLVSLMRQASPEKLAGKQYSGTVVNNVDPLKVYRIQVRSAGLHDGIPDADLPWLMQNTSSGQGASTTVGDICIPAIGTDVSFEFLDESQYHGQYTGNIMSTANTHPELTAGNYPHVVGSVDAANNILLNDTSTGDWIFTFKSGTNFHQLPGGELQVAVAAGFTLVVVGDLTLNAKGKTNLYSSSEVNIAAPIINMNAGSAPGFTAPTARS
jgi:hypothetical protein